MLLRWFLPFALVLMPALVQAASTRAGTVISNQATVEFSVGGSPGEVSSNVVQFAVNQLLEVSLAWQDAGDVGVNTPDRQRVLQFRLTNSGNGSEAYQLRRVDVLPGDDFDPLPAAAGSSTLYLENDRQPGLQTSGPNADTPYVAGANDPLLQAGASVLVYVLSDIPAGLTQLARGQSRLEAFSSAAGVAGAAPGTALPALAAGEPERVVGRSQGQAQAVGQYRVTGLRSLLEKNVASVRDTAGGSLLMPGTELRYRLVLQLQGEGIGENLEIVDELPLTLRYKAGSMSLNGVALTDMADADGGEWQEAQRRVLVRVGRQAAPYSATVEFSAVID